MRTRAFLEAALQLLRTMWEQGSRLRPRSPRFQGSSMTRGLMIAAPRSGSGKTTATLGLLRAFTRRGVNVVGLKSGPDYIDPAFHTAACGREGVNLDSWAMAPNLLAALAAHTAGRSALALCEASMGLFDGVPDGIGRTGASSDVAAALGMPVLLVIDVSGQAQSAAAVAKGCAAYDVRLNVAGVIVNRVGSERHRRLVVEAIEATGVPVVGALPRDDKISLPERHLGLVQAGETEALDARLDAIADFVEAHVDCVRVLVLAGELDCPSSALPPCAVRPPGQRIALARDSAFSFIYPHLVQGWRAAGAEIVSFSPLADEPPPSDCDVCWLPGGYPELHAGRLAAAERFLDGLRRFAKTRPVHGECGGYMALGESLIDAAGVYRFRLRAWESGLGSARPRVPLCDDRSDWRRRPFRLCPRRVRRARSAVRLAKRPGHGLVFSHDRRGVRLHVRRDA